MTNHWSDMGNASLIVVMGANPSENHPASMAHVNRARATIRANGKGARLVVVDPRKTRTALQADRYVRIRPGTDIAFVNGLVRYIINWMETNPADPKSVNFFGYLNQGASGADLQSFFPNKAGVSTGGSVIAAAVKYGSKFTDSRFLLNAAGTDYLRENVSLTGDPLVGGETPAAIIYDFPRKSSNCQTQGVVAPGDPGGAPAGTYDTVYLKLKAHVAPYNQAVVADICGCTAQEVEDVALEYIWESRCASFNPATPTTIINDPAASRNDPPNYRFHSTTMLYAMGLTQHSTGSQNVKSFAVLQSLMGNIGRYGGGINALRGIHNVQGSTDMGLLYGNIPAYSGNPSLQPSADANAFGKYMDALWGNPLSGTAGRTNMNGSYDDAYTVGMMALQQRGFWNMTQKWFGTPDAVGRATMDAVYSLWPKGAGDHHINMFRKMGPTVGTTKALVCWGQNPAVTEPNQSAIRDGLKNLDLLVVVDLFENETAVCDRKAGSATYLIPSASHVETAGSGTNSGRTLQWRYQSRKPAGNSKADLELLCRFAYALDQASAFSHIAAAWAGVVTFTSVYDELYGAPYANGWNPLSATAFEDLSGTAETVAPTGNVVTSGSVTGCEWVAEQVYREMCLPSGSGGTIWIYTGAYNNITALSGATIYTQWQHDNIPGGVPGAYGGWTVMNRAKSRNRINTGTLAYHGWGYAWLVNRRVLYNNTTEAPGDTADFFMGLDSCGRLFTSTGNPPTGTVSFNYSRWYRTVQKLSDVPRKSDNTTPAIHVLPGRFPAHTEPYETPRTDWETWGKNSTGTYNNLLPAIGPATLTGGPGTYPLVLTTIRCVEHFQGGPITRNNGLNNEVEPEPWIEINSADARKYGVVDGQWVNVVTARSNSTTQQVARNNSTPPSGNNSPAALDNFGKGFRARVGSGVTAGQRVAPGVVAIPWHWGERGMGNGSRANDLCIDAFDANTQIPESKACLCRIEPA